MIWCLPQPYHERLISTNRVKDNDDYFPFRDIQELYLRDAPEIVVVEITTPSFSRAITMIKRLYKLKPSKFYVFGLHATYFKDEIKCDEFEIIDIFPELWAMKMVDPKYKDVDELDNLDKWGKKAFLGFFLHRPIRRVLRVIRLTGFSAIPAIALSAFRLAMFTIKSLVKGKSVLFRLE